MPFRSPVTDVRFVLDQVVGFGTVQASERFSDASADVTEAILEGLGRLCDDAMAPLNRSGDLHPARLEDDVVRTSPGFADAWREVAEGGWVGIAADPAYGGMGLPFTLATAMNEMMAGACLSLQICPLLSQGQIEALENHASDEIKALYLPKLISGEWTGTMNLTEPQAGSDVGALATRAVPNEDGTFAITGQKIFISWGDHDFGGNICHLVLARLPDAGPGTRGISLFLVPKYIPNADGTLGDSNSLKVVSLEHKLGLHGSPTAVMEYDGATGWLIGEPHGGMAAMFTMMNNARVGVAAQGTGLAEAAYQHALTYALERKQGRAGGTGTISEHADVRRMLTAMKAEIFAGRALHLAAAVAIDMAHATGDADWEARGAFLTPIAKNFGSELGVWAASEGVQIYGGMGFVEETGAAQFLRDARITPIYEGTNGIQAMDLVGRKMMDGGEAAYRLLDEIEGLAETTRARYGDLAEALWGAAETLREVTEWMIEQDTNDRFAVAVPYARAFARVLGGYYHLKAASAEGVKAARVALARFYILRLLPEHASLLTQVRQGAAGLYDLSPEELVA